MVKNIIFDMGQVLIEFNPENFVRALEYTDEEEIKYITNHIFYSKTWKDMDSGVITSKEGYAFLINTIDEKYKNDAEILTRTWWKIRKPIEGMIDLIKIIRKKGFRLYLLSNASDDHVNYWQNLPYKEYFDGIYVSALHKKIKPNKDIYEDFLTEFNLKRNECLFIDDTKENVDGAIKCDIKSHQFINTDELIKYLKDNCII